MIELEPWYPGLDIRHSAFQFPRLDCTMSYRMLTCSQKVQTTICQEPDLIVPSSLFHQLFQQDPFPRLPLFILVLVQTFFLPPKSLPALSDELIPEPLHILDIPSQPRAGG